MHVSEKGQVTIPKHLRDRLGLGAGSEVEFEQQGDGLVLRKKSGSAGRGAALTERLRRRGDRALTTDEIMALTRGDDV